VGLKSIPPLIPGVMRNLNPRILPNPPPVASAETVPRKAADPLCLEEVQSITRRYMLYPPERVEECVRSVLDNGIPEGASVLWFRGPILSKSLHFSTQTLLDSLELFVKHDIPDQLYFREIGKVLFGRIKDMPIQSVARMLHLFDAVGLGGHVINSPLHERLSSIVNRASIPQIVDILSAVSRSETKLLYRLKIAELCLNRYSLYLRSEAGESVDIDRVILASMCRLRLVHEGTARKILRRFVTYHKRVPMDVFYEIMSAFNALGVDVRHLRRTDDSPVGSISASTSVFGVCDPQSLVRAQPTNPSEEYKFIVGLSALKLLEPPQTLEDALKSLSVSELRRIHTLLQKQQLTEKRGMHFECEDFKLEPKFICNGVFRTLIASPPKKANSKQ
jgi:hypothetical protein